MKRSASATFLTTNAASFLTTDGEKAQAISNEDEQAYPQGSIADLKLLRCCLVFRIANGLKGFRAVGKENHPMHSQIRPCIGVCYGITNAKVEWLFCTVL